VSDAKPERQRLLSLIGDQLLVAGVDGASLSGIARAVGSNNRMLLYYFGSREEMIIAAGVDLVNRFPRINGLNERLSPDGSLAERLDAAWDQIAHPDNVPYIRLFFEFIGMAARKPDNAGILQAVVGGLPESVREAFALDGHSPEQSLRLATQVVAMWRGFQVNLLAGVPREELRIIQAAAVRSLLADQPVSTDKRSAGDPR